MKCIYMANNKSDGVSAPAAADPWLTAATRKFSRVTRLSSAQSAARVSSPPPPPPPSTPFSLAHPPNSTVQRVCTIECKYDKYARTLYNVWDHTAIITDEFHSLNYFYHLKCKQASKPFAKCFLLKERLPGWKNIGLWMEMSRSLELKYASHSGDFYR